MQLEQVIIKNFRGIDAWELALKPGVNLIKGENGKGKTSILEAIAVGLGGFVTGLEGVKARHFLQDEIRQIYTVVGDGSYMKKVIVPTEVTIRAQLDGQVYEWTRGRNSIKASRSTMQPRALCRKAEKMAADENAELPILSYMGGRKSLVSETGKI